MGWGLLLQMKTDRQSDLRKDLEEAKEGRNVNIYGEAFLRVNSGCRCLVKYLNSSGDSTEPYVVTVF